MAVRKLSTGVLSLLLAGAGALQVAASAQRWWPACRPGALETAACRRAQNHRYDLALPSDPWVAVGHASVLAGLSLLLLGAAVTALPLLLRPGRRPVLVWLLCAALGVSQLLAGLSTLVAGLLGHTSHDLWAPFVVFVVLGWPVALTLTSILMAARVRRPAAGWLVLIVLLAASTPLVQVLAALTVTGDLSSSGSAPWSEVWGGSCLLLAALAVWPAAYRRRRHRATAARVSLADPALVSQA